MTIRSFIFADLHKSAFNVRTNAEDCEATAALEASIARVGLLQALVVHPAGDDASTPWAVLAGGRRLRAIGQLIDAGTLAPDWPISAVVIDAPAAEITEMSLGENLLRRDLRPYEVHAAIAQAVAQGDSVRQVADRLGQSEQWVARQLRLGTLARPIFDAYAAGDLSFDHAAAYAATADTVLQESTFAALAQLGSWDHTPARIRAALKVGDRDAARLLQFVGELAYLGAGGAYETDLFNDGSENRVRITDEVLLRRLAEEHFAIERERVRTASQRPELRFAATPPQFGGRDDTALEVTSGNPPLATVPTTAIVATIKLDYRGDPQVRFWWVSRAAKGAAEKGKDSGAPLETGSGVKARAGEALAMPDSDFARQARQIAKDDYGLTADGLQLVRSLRRALLRQLLLENGDEGGNVGTDYLVWAQARALLAHAHSNQTGARAIASEWSDGSDRPPPAAFQSFFEDCEAQIKWQRAVEVLQEQPFMAEPDPAASLQLYFDEAPHWKKRTTAIVAGVSLLRSADTPGWRIAAHDVLVRACLPDGETALAPRLRRWWQPNARWLGLFGKMFRLEAAKPFVDADTLAGFAKLKDADLTAAVATALDPAQHSDPVVKTRAQNWLPQLIGFGPDPEPEPSAPADPLAANRAKVKDGLKRKSAGGRAPVEQAPA